MSRVGGDDYLERIAHSQAGFEFWEGERRNKYVCVGISCQPIFLFLFYSLYQMAPQQKSGIAIGLNKGHITTRRELKQKPSYRQGVRRMKQMDG
jgi:hypothetical protein